MSKLKNILLIVVLTLVSVLPVSCSAIETTTKVVNGKIYDVYEVKPKETVYSLSKKLGITQEELIKYNPQVADGLKKNELLYFPRGVIKNTSSSYKTYKIKKGESLYSIAKKYGTTVDKLLEINPEVSKDKYKTGTVIFIPDNVKKKNKEVENKIESDTTIIEDIVVEEKDDVIDVAVILPFMLSNQHITKNTKLKTEFYKGFLMAVEKNKNKKINIYAYDTAESLDTVKSILQKSELKNIDVIIAPEDDKQFAEIANFAMENQCQVLNVFSTKNELFKNNPYIINVNVTQELMYDEAVDAYIKQLKGYNPVILVNKAGTKDKKVFVDKMRNAFVDKDMAVEEIEFVNELSIDSLARFKEDGKYAFILESSKRDELQKVVDALEAFQNDSVYVRDVKLLGYPDWIILKGTLEEKLHKFNTVIYSRFYSDENSAGFRDFENDYHSWYGEDLIQTMPSQGILGYDIGMFILKDKHGKMESGDKYKGIQTDFNLNKISDESGLVNQSVIMINFSSDGELIKIELD